MPRYIVKDYYDCTRCPLHQFRRNIVFGRGSLPADIMFCGEGAGKCISGDTLIDTAYRDKSEHPDGIPIRDLVGKKDFQVYSFDNQQNDMALGTVRRVWKTGRQRVFKVSFFWWGAKPNGKGGRHKYFGSIKVTKTHPFLLRTGGYLSLADGLKIGSCLQPFYRYFDATHGYAWITASHKLGRRKEGRYLLSKLLGRVLAENEECHHKNRKKLDDTETNIQMLTTEEHARLHGYEDNAMFKPKARERFYKIMKSKDYRERMRAIMKKRHADPVYRKKVLQRIRKARWKTAETVRRKFAEDPKYYENYLRGRKTITEERVQELICKRFPDNHEIYKIEPCGIEDVYDMEVEKYHNFAANGIFVHNSEDLLGIPFVGPSGRLLEKAIERATVLSGVPTPSYFITNIVACRPTDSFKGENRPPSPEEAYACFNRLQKTYFDVRPKRIVTLGDVPKKYIAKTWPGAVNLPHPAAILRAGGLESPMFRRFARDLSEVFRSLEADRTP